MRVKINFLILNCRLRKKGVTSEEVEELEKNILTRKDLLFNFEQTLPKENGLYLKIILGNVNVSILNKNDKYEL